MKKSIIIILSVLSVLFVIATPILYSVFAITVLWLSAYFATKEKYMKEKDLVVTGLRKSYIECIEKEARKSTPINLSEWWKTFDSSCERNTEYYYNQYCRLKNFDFIKIIKEMYDER